MLDVLMKQILKSVDFEKLQKDLLNDPRVREALDLATSIRDDFAAIKASQAEIISRLDALQMTVDNSTVATKPAKRKNAVEKETENG